MMKIVLVLLLSTLLINCGEDSLTAEQLKETKNAIYKLKKLEKKLETCKKQVSTI